MILGMVFFKQPVIFFIKEMTNFFKNSYGVRFFFGVLAQINKLIKKLIDIGQVKISCNNQVFGHPVILSQKRMTIFNAVFAKSTVAEMAQKQLPGKAHIFFEPINII